MTRRGMPAKGINALCENIPIQYRQKKITFAALIGRRIGGTNHPDHTLSGLFRASKTIQSSTNPMTIALAPTESADLEDLQTGRIQEAIDTVAARGGGTVRIGRAVAKTHGIRLYVFDGPKLAMKTSLSSVQMASNAARRVVDAELVVASVEGEPSACNPIGETADARSEVGSRHGADSLPSGVNPTPPHPCCRCGPALAVRPRSRRDW